MNRKKVFLILVMGWGAVQTALADSVGDVGRQFLLLPHEARESAMGGSFASLSDSAMGVFCNPAALIQARERDLSLTHLSWFGGANEESAAYLQPVEGFGTMGGGLALYSIHPFDNTGGAEAPFSSLSYEGLASGAFALPNFSQLSAGGSLKYAGMSLGEMEQTSDLSLDLGLFYKADWKPLRLGFVVENISLLTMAESPPPLSFRAGASLAAKDALLALEMVRMEGQNYAFQLGGEYWVRDLVAFRAGVKAEDAAASFLSPSFGVGLKIGENYRLDYAASSLGDLGFVQWVSLGFLFAAPERVALKRPPSPKVTSPSTTLTSEPQISKSILPSKPVPALSPPYRKSYDIFQQALAESPLKSIHTPSAYSSTGKSGFPLSTNVAQNSVEIAWPAQASGDAAVQGYNVYVSIVPGADFRKLNEAPIVATRWSGEMGLHGMTYYFLVKAIGPQGTETQSSEIKSVDLP